MQEEIAVKIETTALSEAIMPRTVYDEIIIHAREGKPEEVCGILRGRGLRADALYRGRNIAADRIDNYEVDPQTLLLQFDFEDEGDEMMGIYHSHPISEAYPSATDAWNAHYPDSIYFICSLEFDEAPVIRAFRMTPVQLELDVAIFGAALPFREVRKGLFGYFQSDDDPVPPALADLAATTTISFPPPFYVVYFVDEGDGSVVDARLVTVREHPLNVEAAS
jgi:proteasome lid subunit RPN8/RPN11